MNKPALIAWTIASILMPFGVGVTAAAPQQLRADITSNATINARAACKNNDFDSFLVNLASAPPSAQRKFFARTVEVVIADRRVGNAAAGEANTIAKKVANRSFAAFPIAMYNHHFVHAHEGKLSRDSDGAPEFLRVTHKRQTATLTDYPVNIVNVSWQKIRYGVAAGRPEGEIVASYGASGRLIFANGRSNCWELINSYTTLQSDALRPSAAEE